MTALDIKGKLGEFINQYPPARFRRGEIILRPNDKPDYLHFIISGHVRVYTLTEWGDVKLQVIMTPGEFLPIYWIFAEYPITEYFEAIDQVVLRRIPRRDFLRFVKNYPQSSEQVVRYILSMFKMSVERADNLLFTDAYSRIIARLLYLAADFGVPTTKGLLIDIPVSQKDIAFSIAMTRETASRQISRLVKKKLISYKNHRLLILDKDKLEYELAQSHERKAL